MLTWIDCLSLADLTADEVRAIAEHERIPEMAAVELGAWLCQDENGVRHVKTMIREDLAAAVARGDVLCARRRSNSPCGISATPIPTIRRAASRHIES